MQLNLSKEETRNIVNIVLSKAGYEEGVEAKVNIVLDASTSMESLYKNGTVQALVDRALAVGYKFDDDGNIDVFQFAHAGTEVMLPQATQDDHGSYNLNRPNGGTQYSPVTKLMTDFYYKKTVTKKGGFLGFGKKTVVESAEGRDGLEDNYPVFCIFITDGASGRPDEDRRVLNTLLKSYPDMFIQFIGIKDINSPYLSNFDFLREFSYGYDNCGFAQVDDINSVTDEQLLTAILSEKAKKVLTK